MALKRRKLTKKQKAMQRKYTKMESQEYMVCRGEGCRTIFYDVAPDVKSILCAGCVQKLCPWESKAKEPKEKRPRGWHRKKHYISPSGIEYSYGKEIGSTENEK